MKVLHQVERLQTWNIPNLYFILLTVFGFYTILIFTGCNDPDVTDRHWVKIQGKTMGTTYQITCLSDQTNGLKAEIDSLLMAINQEVSTYIDSSTISLFNRSGEDFFCDSSQVHFIECLEASGWLYELSSGAFDPTVMPIVNYWGFGYTPQKPVTKVDTLRVDSLLTLVGMKKIKWSPVAKGIHLQKEIPGIQLDFSAIAKGYAVDVVGTFLKSKGIDNLLVDIGGEARVWGANPQDSDWVLGINKPTNESGLKEIFRAVQLRNKAIATSGNYRNYYTVDNVTYSHTINPFTGLPERTNLLSASIVAQDCMTADALATACMVMGLDKATTFFEKQRGLDALLIYSGNNDSLQFWVTDGMEKRLVPATY